MSKHLLKDLHTNEMLCEECGRPSIRTYCSSSCHERAKLSGKLPKKRWTEGGGKMNKKK